MKGDPGPRRWADVWRVLSSASKSAEVRLGLLAALLVTQAVLLPTQFYTAEAIHFGERHRDMSLEGFLADLSQNPVEGHKFRVYETLNEVAADARYILDPSLRLSEVDVSPLHLTSIADASSVVVASDIEVRIHCKPSRIVFGRSRLGEWSILLDTDAPETLVVIPSEGSAYFVDEQLTQEPYNRAEAQC